MIAFAIHAKANRGGSNVWRRRSHLTNNLSRLQPRRSVAVFQGCGASTERGGYGINVREMSDDWNGV
jgi:hypothetical protein